MKIVVFGLSITSSWGNGHATLWRGLCRALDARGHTTVFFERDVPYYASQRDMLEFEGCSLRLYSDWNQVKTDAEHECADADVAMVTSYCPDSLAACETVLESRARVRCFYDLDTPVTLVRLREGQRVDYLPSYGLEPFDLVLSYTGGQALEILQRDLGAKLVAPLYGSVDPEVHSPADPMPEFQCELSYLGTYATDRQAAVSELLLKPAQECPESRFVIGGAQYPQDFPWGANIYFVRHLPPALHPAFYCSSRATLNVTRAAMAEMGYCPQGRLFEAAACGTPIYTDTWVGLDEFYKPGEEVFPCTTRRDVLDAMSLSDAELRRAAMRARERTLDCHTARQRAIDFEQAVGRVDAKSLGHHSSGREGKPYPAARVLEGTPAGRQQV